jgi:hypothetical protein
VEPNPARCSHRADFRGPAPASRLARRLPVAGRRVLPQINESEKLVAALGGLPLGGQSSHLRADQLAVCSGRRRPRGHRQRWIRARSRMPVSTGSASLVSQIARGRGARLKPNAILGGHARPTAPTCRTSPAPPEERDDQLVDRECDPANNDDNHGERQGDVERESRGMGDTNTLLEVRSPHLGADARCRRRGIDSRLFQLVGRRL